MFIARCVRHQAFSSESLDADHGQYFADRDFGHRRARHRRPSLVLSSRTSSKHLKERFGPEYDRTVERRNSRDLAEKELREREARITRYKIVSLSREDSQRYQTKWTAVQAQFVDEPKVAVSEANFLIQEVMTKRGYPVSDFEQSAADLSVEYPVVVESYRTACEIAERNKRGAADTEELRQAFVSYRTLFEDLLGTDISDSDRRQADVVKPSLGRKSKNRKGMHP